MNVSFNEKDNDNQSVIIQVTCSPYSAELITALIAPLIYEADVLQVSQAFPEALLQLASRVNLVRDWENKVHWNRTSSELLSTFISTMREFRERLSFNWAEWAEHFVDHLGEMLVNPACRENQHMYQVIKAVVNQVKLGAATYAQTKAYLYPDGLPCTFDEWTEQICGDKLSDEVLSDAHFGLLNVKKLREMTCLWMNKETHNETS